MCPTETKIRELIKELTEDYYGGEEEYTDESRLVEDLGLDSLDTLELLMAFEEEFDIELNEEEMEKLQTIGEVVKYLIPKCQ